MSLRDLCHKYNIRFKRQLGQNLLLDDNINRIMVDAADLTTEDDVIEVGAGLGALTHHLYKKAGRVLAIEIDRAFMPCLEDQFQDIPNIKLFRGDVLNHSLPKLIEEFIPGGHSHKLVANLPYYITTPILFHFLESPLPFKCLVIMVQEEVGMRMIAPVNASDYGVLSLAMRWHAEVDLVHKVPSTCFTPRPKVDSCIMRLRCRPQSLAPDLDTKFLMSVVRAAFSQRRKTLRNSLVQSGNFGAPQAAVLAAFEETGIDPSRRPQTLSIDDFIALARSIRVKI